MSRLEKVIGEVLSIDAQQLTDLDGPGTIEAWDSLNHVMLAGALEEEFGVSLSADDLMTASTVGDFRRILLGKGCDV